MIPNKKRLVVEVESSTYELFFKSFSGVLGADVCLNLITGIGIKIEFSGVLIEVLKD